ncbi:MAG: glycosyl hydrolase [Planctomycetes bacterium]|nr:glycosyl hydrolase [Planctomycetota bacterium]
MRRLALASLVLALAAPYGTAQDQDHDFVVRDVLGRLKWRSLGPANFGGRIVDFAVDERRPSTFYAATGSGGVFKTVNRGTTWTAVFDDQPCQSIGDIALAPSNPDVLYVGTGEANNQRSSYWGNGVYRSPDGGRTWQHLGLAGSEHIGRIAVHPTDPDVVFVAALGALYTPNEDRGLYKSTDGGKTWKRVAHVNRDTGFVDVAIDPKDPKYVYAASYERRRRAHDFDGSGPGSGIWRSEDGGETFRRVQGGLPSGEIGRIGLDLYRGNPEVLYATVENLNPSPTGRPVVTETAEPADATIRREPREDGKEPEEAPQAQDRAPAERRRVVGGEIYRSDDRGKTWKKTNSTPVGGSPGYYYGQIRVDPRNDQRLYVLSVPVHVSEDGGKTFKTDVFRDVHVDHHALWIHPEDSKVMLIGNDGGMAITYDGGRHCDHLNDLPIGQFYTVSVDLREPYWVYGGTQDNGTWAIPSRATAGSGPTRADATKLNGGDGFYVAVCPSEPNIVYSESQFGGLSRLHVDTGTRRAIKPRAATGQPALRFNWMAPFLISPHDPSTVYFASQYLHRSRNRGDAWTAISPDLTTNDPDKLKGNVPHCTITTLAESPRREGLLLAGTDDGRVWLTRNGGGRWVELSDRFAGVPRGLWVSRVECSPHDADTFWVAFTGYREDLRTPYLYQTTDGGESFLNIAHNLPASPINVVRAHPRNKNVLLVGQEHGVQVSWNGGGTWAPLGGGLPAVAVHDLVVHPRERDVVIGTHGRGFYVLAADVLEELDPEVLGRALHVFAPRDGRTGGSAYGKGNTGHRRWLARNPETSPTFTYFLKESVDDPVQIQVLDASERVVFRQNGPAKAGLQTVTWNPRGAGFGGMFGGGRRGGQGAAPAAGQYRLRVTHGQTTVEHAFWLRADRFEASPALSGEEDADGVDRQEIR